jgi:hypothetical protein
MIGVCRCIFIFSHEGWNCDFLPRKLTKNFPQVKKYRDFSMIPVTLAGILAGVERLRSSYIQDGFLLH